MTSETELDIIKTVDTNDIKEEESNNQISSNVEEPINDPVINIDKPKRAGRKKREATSLTDTKTESFNNDNPMDTQPLFEQPIIVEGKRSRKPTSRLELSDLETPKKELSIPQGHGKALGEIEYINYQITHASPDALSRMRNICFGRRGSKTNIRKNLQDFNGFEFERDSEEYQRHLSSLTKLKKDQLQSLSDILGLPSTDSNDENAVKILNFLIEPIDEGKTIPESKMSTRTSTKSNTNSKEAIHIDEEENDIEEKIENGDDELFEYDEEDDDEEDEKDTDDDYIGSDEESGLNTKDDPDDFVYQPGKKIPKKRPSIKRSRSGTTHKRKRGGSTSKRGRKKTKVIVNKKVENEDIATVPIESVQINDEKTEKIEDVAETKNDDLNNIDTTLTEQNSSTTNNTTTDIISTTS